MGNEVTEGLHDIRARVEHLEKVSEKLEENTTKLVAIQERQILNFESQKEYQARSEKRFEKLESKVDRNTYFVTLAIGGFAAITFILKYFG